MFGMLLFLKLEVCCFILFKPLTSLVLTVDAVAVLLKIATNATEKSNAWKGLQKDLLTVTLERRRATECFFFSTPDPKNKLATIGAVIWFSILVDSSDDAVTLTVGSDRVEEDVEDTTRTLSPSLPSMEEEGALNMRSGEPLPAMR